MDEGRGIGKGEDGASRGKKQGNAISNRKEGDRVAMRETTDPTYNFADMTIGVLSYLKLIPKAKDRWDTEGELRGWGKRGEERRGGRFQSQGLYSLIQTPAIFIYFLFENVFFVRLFRN